MTDLMIEGHPSDAKRMTAGDMLLYQLPERSSMGPIRWVQSPPDGVSQGGISVPQTGGSAPLRFTLPRRGWLAPNSREVTPYMEFDLTLTTTNAADDVRVVPWAVFSDAKVFVNGHQVSGQFAGNFAAVMSSWVARQGPAWAQSEGETLGLVNRDPATGSYVSPLSDTPATPGTYDDVPSGTATRFVVPFPQDFSILTSGKAFPLAAVNSVVIELYLSGFTSFAQRTAAAADVLTCTISNLNIWLPLAEVHSDIDRAFMERLDAAERGEASAVVIETGYQNVQAISVPRQANTYSLQFTYPIAYAQALEFVQHVPQPAAGMGWRGMAAPRGYVTSYQFFVDDRPTSDNPVSTGRLEAYTRFLDYISALNRAQTGQSSGTVVALANSRIDAMASNAAAQACPYFAATQTLTAPDDDRNTIESTRGFAKVRLDITKVVNDGNLANIDMMGLLITHAKARIAISRSDCRLQA